MKLNFINFEKKKQLHFLFTEKVKTQIVELQARKCLEGRSS